MRSGVAWSLLLAALALLLLGSVPVVLMRHFNKRAAEPLRSMANGTVVDVSPSGRGFVATIEYRPTAAAPGVRFFADAGRLGFLRPRPRLAEGDVVLVEFDPAQPEDAHVFSIRDLWSSVVGLGAGGVALLVGSVVVFFRSRRPRRSDTHGPTAAGNV